MDYKKLNGDAIIKWCIENNQVKWLKEAQEKYGSFLALKRAFALEFMPEIVPVAKEKPLTFADKVAALKA